MSKKELAIALSKLKTFTTPNIKTEQYPTDSEIAADFLWEAMLQGDIEGKTIADLGAGTGILGIGALLIGAKMVYFVDIDQHALKIALENIRDLKGSFEGQAMICHEDVTMFNDKVDVIIMNPPFGTREEHADKRFLEKAATLAPTIYSFHKASTKQFINSAIHPQGFYVVGYKEYAFPLKQTMSHHTKTLERIQVGLWKFVRKS